MGASCVVTIRLSAALKEKAEKRAVALGYIKPSGGANISEYIRNLVVKDANSQPNGGGDGGKV